MTSFVDDSRHGWTTQNDTLGPQYGHGRRNGMFRNENIGMLCACLSKKCQECGQFLPKQPVLVLVHFSYNWCRHNPDEEREELHHRVISGDYMLATNSFQTWRKKKPFCVLEKRNHFFLYLCEGLNVFYRASSLTFHRKMFMDSFECTCCTQTWQHRSF